MKPTLTLLVCLLVPAFALASIEASWTARAEKDGRVHLNSSRNNYNNWGMTFEASEFAGLDRAAMQSEVATPVHFQLKRDAGTMTFEGTFRRGFGAGQLTFEPNFGYRDSLRAAGFTLERGDEEELFKLGMIDVSVAYVREMHALFPETDLHELRSMRAVGVTSQWLREMRAAGVAIESGRDAKKLAAVGVDVKFIRELAAAGYTNLSVHDLSRMAAVGVDGDFIREMSKYKENKR